MPWSAAAGSLLTLAGSAIGSALSNKGGGTTQTQSSTEPWWSQAQRLNNEIYPAASGLYAKGPAQYYPGQTVASQSPYTTQSIEALAGQSAPGSLTNQGQAEFGKTIAGDYLKPESNPYLQSNLNNAFNDIQSRVAGTFGTKGGNNYGSSAHQEWLGRSLMEAASPLLNQNYQTERGRQLNAAQLAPQMGQAGATALGQAGTMQDAYQQSLINANKAKFDFGQTAPWDALNRYQAVLQGNVGSQTTTQQPYFGANPYLNAFGGGLAAYGAFNQNQPRQTYAGGSSPNSIGNTTSSYDPYDYPG